MRPIILFVFVMLAVTAVTGTHHDYGECEHHRDCRDGKDGRDGIGCVAFPIPGNSTCHRIVCGERTSFDLCNGAPGPAGGSCTLTAFNTTCSTLTCGPNSTLICSGSAGAGCSVDPISANCVNLTCGVTSGILCGCLATPINGSCFNLTCSLAPPFEICTPSPVATGPLDLVQAFYSAGGPLPGGPNGTSYTIDIAYDNMNENDNFHGNYNPNVPGAVAEYIVPAGGTYTIQFLLLGNLDSNDTVTIGIFLNNSTSIATASEPVTNGIAFGLSTRAQDIPLLTGDIITWAFIVPANETLRVNPLTSVTVIRNT